MNYLKPDEVNHTQNHILKKLKNIGILLLYKIGRKLRYIYIIILIMLYKHIQNLEDTAKDRPEDFRGWQRKAVDERRAFFESKEEDRVTERVRPTTANPQARK